MNLNDILRRAKVTKPADTKDKPPADPKDNDAVLKMLKPKAPAADPNTPPAKQLTRQEILMQLASQRNFSPEIDDALREKLGDNVELVELLMPLLQTMGQQIYVNAINDTLNAVPNMVNSHVRTINPAISLENAIGEDDVLGHEDIREYSLRIANDLVAQNPQLTTKQALDHTRQVFERMGSRVSGVDIDAAKAHQTKQATQKPGSTTRVENGVTIESNHVDDWVTDFLAVGQPTPAGDSGSEPQAA